MVFISQDDRRKIANKFHNMLFSVMARKSKDLTPRFGIGEWYGYNLTQLSGEARQQFAYETLKVSAPI